MARFKPPTDWNSTTPLTLGFMVIVRPLSIPRDTGLKSVSDVSVVLRWHRVATRLRGSGRSLEREGKQVNDPEQQRKLVEEACTAFLETALPELARLGIVSA